MTNNSTSKILVEKIIDSIEDIKGENITLLDLTEIDNSVCEYFIICEGNSNTQVNAISSNVEKKVRNDLKERPIHIEGTENSQWILMDYGNVVVHVFQKQKRDYYNLENMWGDAKSITV